MRASSCATVPAIAFDDDSTLPARSFTASATTPLPPHPGLLAGWGGSFSLKSGPGRGYADGTVETVNRPMPEHPLAHIAAFAEIRSFTEVVVCGRTPRKVDAAVDYARTLGLAARSGDASEVRDADVVVCTTSAAEPLFDGALVPDTACVVAMGSHEHVPPAHSDVAVQDSPHGQPHREEGERGESV